MIRSLLTRLALRILRGTPHDPELLRAGLVAAQLRAMNLEEQLLRERATNRAWQFFAVDSRRH